MQPRPPIDLAQSAQASYEAAGAQRAQAIVRALVERGLANKPWHLWMAQPFAAWCTSPYSHDLAQLVARWATGPGAPLPAALKAALTSHNTVTGAHLAAAALSLAQLTPKLWHESEQIGRQVGIAPFSLGDETGHIIDLKRLDLGALAFADPAIVPPLEGVLLRIDGPPVHITEAWEATTLAMLLALQTQVGQLWRSCTVFAQASLAQPGTMRKSSWQPGPHARLGAQLRRSFGGNMPGTTYGGPICHWYDIDARMQWQGEFHAARAAFAALQQERTR